MSYGAVILAAGDGKRMQSKLPKVLHNFAGMPILLRIIKETVQVFGLEEIVVVVGDKINLEQLQATCKQEELLDNRIIWAKQALPLGTGDAVATGLKCFSLHIKKILIISGDLPLISRTSLNLLINHTLEPAIGILTNYINNPYGLGRIVRDQQQNFLKIIEESEATAVEKTINEVNIGVYLFPKVLLNLYLPKLNQHNQQQEYYLTAIFDVIAQPQAVCALQPLTDLEGISINSRQQLIQLERQYYVQQANKLLEQGVTVVDPNRLDIRGDIEIGTDVTIDINVILVGKIHIGSEVTIGANCYIKDSILGVGVIIAPNSIIEGAIIEQQAKIGPFARIRPKSYIKNHSKVGNFVEIKNSTIGMYSKVNHLSYIGDGQIGQRVNIGAGVITCNYDGMNKYATIIKDNVAVGAGCQLIAPIVIETAATIAAGTTLIKDAPEYRLTLNKKIQYSLEWQRPTKINGQQLAAKTNQICIEK